MLWDEWDAYVRPLSQEPRHKEFLYRVFGGLSDVPPEDAEQLRNYEQCRTAVMAESMALYHFCKHD